jgi:TDG/mug DNA glycosylase family protein
VQLDALVRDWQPRLVAVVGVTAYRTAFGDRGAKLGLQDGAAIGERPVWVLPNPSGLNAHHQLPELARLFGEARKFAGGLAF